MSDPITAVWLSDFDRDLIWNIQFLRFRCSEVLPNSLHKIEHHRLLSIDWIPPSCDIESHSSRIRGSISEGTRITLTKHQLNRCKSRNACSGSEPDFVKASVNT
jgi:hypothetical protein